MTSSINSLLLFKFLKFPYSFIENRYLILYVTGKLLNGVFRIKHFHSLSISIVTKRERLWDSFTPFTKNKNNSNKIW